ncbi:MAG: hypothetical protein H0X66_12940 [Verrucomicrobia bacterium]|nr:hypothetical protein [Verrucomicrobiota bacterium]
MAAVQRGSINRFTVFGKTAVAGLLIAWVLAAALISSDSHLHEAFHHDSAQQTHDCAISLFERGQTLSSDPACEVVLQANAPTETEVVSISQHFTSFRFLSNTTRGPPV